MEGWAKLKDSFDCLSRGTAALCTANTGLGWVGLRGQMGKAQSGGQHLERAEAATTGTAVWVSLSLSGLPACYKQPQLHKGNPQAEADWGRQVGPIIELSEGMFSPEGRGNMVQAGV